MAMVVEDGAGHSSHHAMGSCGATVGVIATTVSPSGATGGHSGALHLLLNSQTTRGDPIQPICTVEVVITNPKVGTLAHVAQAGANGGGATVRHMDTDHANPRRTWKELGMPQYPTAAEKRKDSRSICTDRGTA
jgi:hypothetical protein